MTTVLFIQPGTPVPVDSPKPRATGNRRNTQSSMTPAASAPPVVEERAELIQPWFDIKPKKAKRTPAAKKTPAKKAPAEPKIKADKKVTDKTEKAEATTRHGNRDSVIALTYRYGCPAWFSKLDTEPRKEGDDRPRFPKKWDEQIWLAHRLNNDLVASEHTFYEMWSALKPPKPPKEGEVVEIEESTEDFGFTDLDEETKEKLREQLKADKKLAPTKLRAEAVEKGLFWSTASMVLRGHRTAQKLIQASWKNGKPAKRGFRRYDGSGTLHTQIMWNKDQPLPTPDRMMADPKSPWRNVCRIKPYVAEKDWVKGKSVKAVIHLRMSPGGKAYPVPIYMDRPLPAGADITEVRLVRKKIGKQYRIHVCIGLNVPKPPAPTEGETVAVKIGWKSEQEDGVKVATIATASGKALPDLPKDLEKFVRIHADGTADLLAPRVWQRLLERDDRIRGYRDDNFNTMRDRVVDALKDNAALFEWFTEQGIDVAHMPQWRAHARLEKVARLWPEDHPLKGDLIEWIRREWHLHQYEAHERDGIAARRRHVYRVFASWIGKYAKEIVISGMEIAVLKEARKDDEPQAKAVRRNLHYAAPGDLRMCIANAAYRRNIPLVLVTNEKVEETEEEGQDNDQ